MKNKENFGLVDLLMCYSLYPFNCYKTTMDICLSAYFNCNLFNPINYIRNFKKFPNNIDKPRMINMFSVIGE